MTTDICLLPPGASHEEFQFRVSLSDIDRVAPFSAFPGVDRFITMIQGNGVELEFERESILLSINQTYHFDSGLCPVGSPIDGNAQVLNVMFRRNAGTMNDCHVTSGIEELDLNGKRFLFVISGVWNVTINDESQSVKTWESVLADNIESMVCYPESESESEGLAIYASISPSN